MKKTKRILAGILSAVMTLSSMTFGVSVLAEETELGFDVGEKTVNVGDYFQMGTYYGKPILWRCVNVDENGPLMLSDKILCLKAFDFAGEDTSSSHGRGNNNGEIWSMNGVVPTRPQAVKDSRTTYGSNYWGDSNIRDWLNSDADAGNVEWSCGNQPTAVYLDGPSSAPVEKSYGYADEAGFLNGFTENEKLAVKTVEQKQLLDHSEYGFDENYHRAEYPVADVLQNYETAASETTTDKMFLLDVKQFYDVYTNFGDYCYAYPTTLAVAKDTNVNRTRGSYRQTASNNDYPQKDKTYYYWLRTPFNNSHKYTYIKDDDPVTEVYSRSGFSSRVAGLKDGYHNNGSVTFELDCMNDIGVRPAFYLDTTNSEITEGDGSANDPYIINGPKHENGFTINGKTYNVGDYFQMGTYNNEAILWRCIDADENGPLMISDKVLCNKVFDSSVSDSTKVSGSNMRNPSYLRKRYGSTYWGDSNIKEWLNSDAESGAVTYSCGNMPDYKDEAGFLNGFTDSERSAVKEVEQKQLLYNGEHTNVIYGDNENKHIYSPDIADVMQNYNYAYSEVSADKIFLPDIKQVYRLYRGFGDYYKTGAYWLRSPSEKADDGYSALRYVNNEGEVLYAYANTADIGIRPAFYLDTTAANITGGTGTEADAYVINGEEEKPVQTISAADIKIGDYVYVGSYYGEPLMWRCVAFEKVTGFDEKGDPITDATDTVKTAQDGYLPLMMSDKILSIKAFDAVPTQETGSHARRNTNTPSNYWGDSNIRSWLNSEAGANSVQWLCGNAPAKDKVSITYYDKEAGFLSNFSSSDLKAVKPVTQKTILGGPEINAGMSTSGSKTYIQTMNGAVNKDDYNNACSLQLTDRIFLPDVMQIDNIHANMDIFGTEYLYGILSEKAAEDIGPEARSLNYLKDVKAGDEWNYWTRTPAVLENYTYIESISYYDGEFHYGTFGDLCSAGDSGVRPTFFLDPKVTLTGGNGTAGNAYVIGEVPDTVIEYDAVGGKIYFDTATGTITGADSAITEVTVPKTIEGIEVKAVAADAFANCAALEKVYCAKESPANNADLYSAKTEIIYDSSSSGFLFGDADANNVITASDSAFVLQKALLSTFELPIQNETDAWMKYVDVDGNNSITANDAAFIFQKTLVSTFEFPTEK